MFAADAGDGVRFYPGDREDAHDMAPLLATMPQTRYRSAAGARACMGLISMRASWCQLAVVTDSSGCAGGRSAYPGAARGVETGRGSIKAIDGGGAKDATDRASSVEGAGGPTRAPTQSHVGGIDALKFRL